MVEGLRYVAKDRIMLRLSPRNFVRAVAFGPPPLVLPVSTKEPLRAGAGIGSLLLTVIGIGGLIARFIMASWGFFAKKGTVGLITLMSGSACLPLLGRSECLWLPPPLLALMGLSQTHFIVSNWCPTSSAAWSPASGNTSRD